MSSPHAGHFQPWRCAIYPTSSAGHIVCRRIGSRSWTSATSSPRNTPFSAITARCCSASLTSSARNRCCLGVAGSSIVGGPSINDIADPRSLRPGGGQKSTNFLPSRHVKLRLDRFFKDINVSVEVTAQRCELFGSLTFCVATSGGKIVEFLLEDRDELLHGVLDP